MSDANLKFELTAEQTDRYKAWLKQIAARHALEKESLEQVTISFTFTPFGQYILAHTGSHLPADGCTLVLQDL